MNTEMAKGNRSAHKLTLQSRESMEVQGVTDVISFDEVTVVLDTLCGHLTVNGEGLHIHTLSLENGKVTVEGKIDEIIYEDESAPKRRSIFGRPVR